MDRLPIDFDNVRVFLRVVEHGSLTAAAGQLGLPLTSVSRRLKALEQALGVQLLHRTTRRLGVSDAGRDFYAACLHSEQVLEQAVASLRKLHEVAEGTLRVLVPYAPGLVVLEPHLARFRRRHPRVQLALSYSNEALDLTRHGLDMALRTGPLADSGYVARRLGLSRAVLVASPGYLAEAGEPQHPQELSQHAILATGNEAPLVQWQLRHRGGDLSEATLRPVLLSSESATLIRQAEHDAGIALLSRHLVDRQLASGRLQRVLPDWYRAPDVELSVLYHKRATLESKVRVFLDFLEEVFAGWREQDR